MEINREALRNLLNDPVTLSTIQQVLDDEAWECVEAANSHIGKGNSLGASLLSGKAEAYHDLIAILQDGLRVADEEVAARAEEEQIED